MKAFLMQDNMHASSNYASSNPGDFSLKLDLSSITLAKIGVIDGGCCTTLEEKDKEFFESITFQQFHSNVCENKAADTMLSPHGVGCASIISGRRRCVNFFNVCTTFIQGVVPGAPLYAYAIGCGIKNCYLPHECLTQAIKQAVEDGVKVLSISLGPKAEHAHAHYKHPEDDPISMALLDATQGKMLVCAAIGNEGPIEGSVVASMPWVMAVGSCTNGQILETTVEIAKKENEKFIKLKELKGVSLNVIESRYLKLRVQKDAWHKDGVLQAVKKHKACYLLQATHGRSKILSTTMNGVALTTISKEQMELLHKLHKEYRGQLFVKISISKYQEDKRGVFVTKSSARGPSRLYKDNVTPEVVALGYAVLMSHPSNIPLAIYGKIPLNCRVDENEDAYEESEGNELKKTKNDNMPLKTDNDEFIEIESDDEFKEKESDDIFEEIKSDDEIEEIESDDEFEERKEMYNNCKISSGTSFACPQVAAYALIVYSYHPEWSPLAVKSALITTASSFAERRILGNEFAFGAGLINLESAINPGLVYDESWENFRKYVKRDLTIFNLNLPTFAASFSYSNETREQIFKRKLTNVSEGDVTYTFDVEFYKKTLDPEVHITAMPSSLQFEPGETKEFTLRVTLHPHPCRGAQISGMIKWLPSKSIGGPPVCSPIHLYHQSSFDTPIWYKNDTCKI